jgi:hypothetical protein
MLGDLLKANHVARLESLLQALRAVNGDISLSDRQWLAELLHPFTWNFHADLRLTPAVERCTQPRELLLTMLLSENTTDQAALKAEISALVELSRALAASRPLDNASRHTLTSLAGRLRKHLLSSEQPTSS